jgi:hypothetical protein
MGKRLKWLATTATTVGGGMVMQTTDLLPDFHEKLLVGTLTTLAMTIILSYLQRDKSRHNAPGDYDSRPWGTTVSLWPARFNLSISA